MLKRFWNWLFPHKKVVRVYLDGGHVIDVRCTDWKFDTNSTRGERRYVGYNFQGLEHYVSLDAERIIAFEVLN